MMSRARVHKRADIIVPTRVSLGSPLQWELRLLPLTNRGFRKQVILAVRVQLILNTFSLTSDCTCCPQHDLLCGGARSDPHQNARVSGTDLFSTDHVEPASSLWLRENLLLLHIPLFSSPFCCLILSPACVV